MTETIAPEADPSLITIGWRERVDLPEFGLVGIRAKADTGARSSALDVSGIEMTNDDRVRFTVRYHSAERRTEEHTFEKEVARTTRVRSSFGRQADRIFVRTIIRLAGLEFECEIGLVDRSKMLCRMLIGRQTLSDRFVVDSAHTYLHGRAHRLPRIAEETIAPSSVGT